MEKKQYYVWSPWEKLNKNVDIPLLYYVQSRPRYVFSSGYQTDALFDLPVAWSSHTHQYVPTEDQKERSTGQASFKPLVPSLVSR